MLPLSDKATKLDEIKQEIIRHQVCPELMAGAQQLVYGDGNIDSDVVLIGEAPGKKEDETGVPFVGAAGKFLDEMLASIGWSRQDIYITNIVKYRPPNNRDPLPAEKKAFLPYLQRQLEVLQPKLVVALGRHAAGCFLPDLVISRDHGQAKRISLRFNGMVDYKIVLLPLYHPAAALYNGSMRQTLISDFAQIPELIRQITTKDMNLLINHKKLERINK
jgi:uracil-DNA glycosylase family 4